MVDPRTGPQVGDGRLVGERLARNSVGVTVMMLGCRLESFSVEGVEEGLAVVVVVLPGILAVEDDGDQVGAVGPSLWRRAADGVDAVDEVLAAAFARRAGVGEADLVGDDHVAEEPWPRARRLPSWT